MKKLLLLFLIVGFGVQAASVTRIATASGNFTAAGTWKSVDATSELDSEAGSTATTTSPVYSSTFSPGAITIDGLAVKVGAISNAPAGTLTIDLRDSSFSSNMVSVTINVADLPQSGDTTNSSGTYITFPHEWLMVTFTPVTLGAGTNYSVGVSSSQAGMVTFYRNATAGNWARMLRTTTTGAPAATDKIIITGAHTGAGAVTSIIVTNENTATTTFGTIPTATFCQSVFVSDHGTLQWSTAASSTILLTVAGVFAVGEGGVVNIGTAADPIPSTSVARLAFDLTATGDSGITNYSGGTFNTYGAAVMPWCWLYADVAASATTFTLLPRNGTTTGWGATDWLLFPMSVRSVSSQNIEVRTNSSWSNVTNGTLAAALTYSHPSTNAAVLCPVGNLTRNVQIWGETTVLNAFNHLEPRSTNSFYFTQFLNIGTGGANKEGGIAAYLSTGTLTVNGCALWGTAGYGIYLDTPFYGSPAPMIVSNVIYTPASGSPGVYFGWNSSTYYSPGYGAGTTVADNLLSGVVGTAIALLRWEGNNTNGGYLTATNNTITSGSSIGIKINGNITALNLDNNTIHSCAQIGLWLNGGPATNVPINGLTIARCGGTTGTPGTGVQISYGDWTFKNCNFFGNAASGVAVNNAKGLLFTNCSWYGETSYLQTNGLVSGFGTVAVVSSGNLIGFSGNGSDISLVDCVFGSPLTNVTADIAGWAPNANFRIKCKNVLMLSQTPVSLPSSATDSWVGSTKHNQTVNSNRFWIMNGSGFMDLTFGHSSPTNSVRQTPTSASLKMIMPDVYSVRLPVISNATRTVSVWIRKSAVGDGAAYNGNQPRLIAKANATLGLTNDTVIATAVGSPGAWEQLSGNAPAPNDNGTLLCYVDCDGTAGWINVDDWAFGALDSRSVAYWVDGFPNVQADNSAGSAASTSGFGFSQ